MIYAAAKNINLVYSPDLYDGCMAAEDTVKKSYPFAHCAPLAHAMYPNFYVIRANLEEWAESIGQGQTPGDAWNHARSQLRHGYEERMQGHAEDSER